MLAGFAAVLVLWAGSAFAQEGRTSVGVDVTAAAEGFSVDVATEQGARTPSLREGRGEGEGLRVGVAKVDVTPECINPPIAAQDGFCPPAAGPAPFDGPLHFVDEEPYVDENGNGEYDFGEPWLEQQLDGRRDGIYLAGFGNGSGKGVHDPIWARTLVLDLGGQRISLTTVDIVGFFVEDVDRARREIRSRDLGLDHIVIASTHEHEGPDTMGLWGPEVVVNGRNPRWMRKLIDGIADSVEQAAASFRPATLTATRGLVPQDGETFDVSFGPGDVRALHFWNGANSDLRHPFYLDDDVYALRFDDATTAETFAVLVNWTEHPETLASQNRMITSDFPHFLRERVEEAFPAATALYFSGAVGGITSGLRQKICIDACATVGMSPPTNAIPDASFPKAEAIGRGVAEEALRALAADPTGLGEKGRTRALEEAIQPISLEWKQREFFAGVDNVFLRALVVGDVITRTGWVETAPGVFASEEVGFGEFIRTEVNLVTLKDASGNAVQIATVPGELFQELANGLPKGDGAVKPVGFSGFPQKESLPPNDRFFNTYPGNFDAANDGNRVPRVARSDSSGQGFYGPDTGPPFEEIPLDPSVRDSMSARFKLVFGLANDELGYIIPQSDFVQPAVLPPQEDRRDRFGNRHGFEGTSGSSKLAPVILSELRGLLGLPPIEDFSTTDGKPLQSSLPYLAGSVGGFLDENGENLGGPTVDDPTRVHGLWIDTSQDRTFVHGTDTVIFFGRNDPMDFGGFLGPNGTDRGNDPAQFVGPEAIELRGAWFEANGEPGYQPGEDAQVYHENFVVDQNSDAEDFEP